MKQLARFLFVIALVLAAPALKLYAQSTFEGTITWSMTLPMMGDDEKHSMIVNVKGDKSETEVDMGAMGTFKSYVDKATNKSYIVVGPKMGYTMDLKNDSGSSSGPALDLKPTGKTKTIAGYAAQEYLLKGMEGIDQMSLWVSPDVPKELREGFHNSFGSNQRADPKQNQAINQLIDKGLTPVGVDAQKDGELAMSMELVKFEKKPLDDALFVPPADIKFQPMPQMGGHGGMN
ncbi:MAG TPA: DUF4412 domain-containing protein [Candidatus Kapabacteria bacterium]|jgi:hypothetical protein